MTRKELEKAFSEVDSFEFGCADLSETMQLASSAYMVDSVRGCNENDWDTDTDYTVYPYWFLDYASFSCMGVGSIDDLCDLMGCDIEKKLSDLLPDEKFATSAWDIIVSDDTVTCQTCYYDAHGNSLSYAIEFPIVDNAVACKRFSVRAIDTISKRSMQRLQAFFADYIDTFFDDFIAL